MFRPVFRALLLSDRADASAHRAKRVNRSTNTLDPAVLLEPAGGHLASLFAYWSVACALLVPVPPLETLRSFPSTLLGAGPTTSWSESPMEVVAHEYVREGANAGLLALEVAGNGTPAASLPRGLARRAEWPGHRPFPNGGHPRVGKEPATAKPAAPAELATSDSAREQVAATRENPTSLARKAILRQDPRWEPSAVAPLAGICAGGGPS
jgi:hypothetical protein